MTTTDVQPSLGYDQRRPELEAWLDQHYIADFNLKPCTLLDLCCGDGFWSMLFDLRGFTVVGIDSNADQLVKARERVRDARNDRTDTGHVLTQKAPVFIPLDVDDVAQLQVFADAYRVASTETEALRPAPEIIFARTIPHFYQPTLHPAGLLIARLLTMVCDHATTILLSIYSDGSRQTIEGATMHPLSEILATIVDAAGRIADAQIVDDYMQIAVTRR
jgi:SAM-dependent methyltransferase